MFEEARDRLEKSEERFAKALSAAYNRIYFPSFDEIERETLVSVTIDNGLQIGKGDQSAETQIEGLLSGSRANYKLAMDLKDNFNEYFAMAEQYLWPSSKDNRRTPWKDLISRAKSNAGWPWMPGSRGMDTLMAEALKQERWRKGKDDYIEKGPFPPGKARVNVSLLRSDSESGESILSLTPRNAGESPGIHYSTKPDVNENDPQVDDLENFSTEEVTLYFWVKDTTGKYESDAPTRWMAELTIRHQVEPSADKRKVTLRCTPKAEMTFTLDGSNPKYGKIYGDPFEIGSDAVRLLVYAKSGEAAKDADFQIPRSGVKTIPIDDTKPTRLNKRVTLGATDKVYGVINYFRKRTNTRFKGTRIDIGEGENTVTVRFQEREITAAMIERTVNSLREVIQEDQSPVAITSSSIQFESGFDAKEFAKIAGIELRPGDITQGR